MNINRVILVIMDSVGVGCMPDACNYNDGDVNTLGHIYKERGSINLPNLCSLGLGRIVEIGCEKDEVIGCFGRMKEVSPGKDTTTGHWEMMGLELNFSFPTYPNGFPTEIMDEFEKRIGRKTLGNYPQSGTEILKELGDEHLKTGCPIVYTSADSVFQIAAHEDIYSLEELYKICRIARNILKGEHSMARVIARPFVGETGNFSRHESGRQDFSLVPHEDTVLDLLKKEGYFVSAIGKIGDIFGHKGTTEEIHTENNMDGIDKTLESMEKHRSNKGLIFLNLVEFDSMFGHRRNIQGYAKALEDLDGRIPQIIEKLEDTDLLIISADHGCDPTHNKHTDHTREYVPLIVYGKKIKRDVDLGSRNSFADCGKTIADILGVNIERGKSFKNEIIQ